MGIPCSKNFPSERVDMITDQYENFHFHKLLPIRLSHSKDLSSRKSKGGLQSDENHLQQDDSFPDDVVQKNASSWSPDEIYDGIPRIPTAFSQKSRSMRSTQAAVAKVSEVSYLLGRAGTVGLEKAVEVLDVLGSSMTDLNSRSGFAYAVAPRGTEIAILAFEIANTIVKGSSLMHSLSGDRIRHVQEVVLLSEGVQELMPKDKDLLRIVVSDKREELKVLIGEVVRFGNLCKDPQWHNLDRYFAKELTAEEQLTQDAELEMTQLMTLVQYTTELYHELHALHRFEKEYKSKHPDEGESQANLKTDLKRQKKVVKKLKKISLWNRSLEEVMEKLVDIVLYLHLKIKQSFSITDGSDEYVDESQEGSMRECQRLGPAGLALHYANIILQIDGMVTRSVSTAPSARDTLYESLPPSIKSALRSRIHSLHTRAELTASEIKTEMEKTLQWLFPLASNTVRAHHGFGWVGEWAYAGSEAHRASAGQSELLRIETLYHADKDKTEAHILEQLVWLHYLFNQSRNSAVPFNLKPSSERPNRPPLLKSQYTEQPSSKSSSLRDLLTTKDHEMLCDVSKRKGSPGISKSEDFDAIKEPIRKHERPIKSSGQSPTRHGKNLSSGFPSTDSGPERKDSDMINQLVHAVA